MQIIHVSLPYYRCTIAVSSNAPSVLLVYYFRAAVRCLLPLAAGGGASAPFFPFCDFDTGSSLIIQCTNNVLTMYYQSLEADFSSIGNTCTTVVLSLNYCCTNAAWLVHDNTMYYHCIIAVLILYYHI